MKTKFTKHGTSKKYKIEIIPDKSLLPKIGDSGHNFYEAVAEFIDNAIDAMTKEQKEGKETLNINIVINVKKKYFSIKDNGIGMDENDARNAARLAVSNKESDKLGHFGMGLKSGLMTISDNFNVSTGKKGNDYKTEFYYDKEEWIKNSDKWELSAKNHKKEKEEHGTHIVVNKVNNIQLSTNKTQYLKNDIAKRYRSFINKGNVIIKVNNIIVKADDIEWAKGYPKKFEIQTKVGKVYGKIGLMKESSQKGYYGFDMFRNNRMILTNSKFAISDHPTIARIKGDINLDFVKVSHEKNKFITESLEYQIAEKACKNSSVFKDLLKEARKKSEDVETKKECVNIKKELSSDMSSIAKAMEIIDHDIAFKQGNGLSLNKNKNGILDGFMNLFDKKKRKEYEKREVPHSDYAKEHKKGNDESQGEVISVNGQTLNIKQTFVSEKSMGRKSYEYDKNKNKLIVFYNTEFQGYKNTKDKVGYCRESLIDSLVSIMYQNHVIVLENYNKTKDDLISNTIKFRDSLKIKEL